MRIDVPVLRMIVIEQIVHFDARYASDVDDSSFAWTSVRQASLHHLHDTKAFHAILPLPLALRGQLKRLSNPGIVDETIQAAKLLVDKTNGFRDGFGCCGIDRRRVNVA